MSWTDRDYLIALNMIQGIGGIRLRALWHHFGSFEKIWRASEEELRQISSIGPKIARAIAQARKDICPRTEQEWARRLGARIVTLVDEGYPSYLQRLAVPPPVLYVAGRLPQSPGIAVVGTRRPSRTGLAQARLFSSAIAVRGEAVISGLARGIDGAAHLAALEAGGQTVAVLGSHLGNIYPPEHQSLARRITAQGAVVSEYPSCSPTLPGNFPRRNRIIAGLSRGVLVVQAGDKSGTINTADWALELGLDVWAVPGEISDPLRAGCHNLIKQGAFLVTDPSELWGGELGPSAESGRETAAARESFSPGMGGKG